MRVKTGDSVSKFLGILSFLLLLILKGVFPKAALAFTGSSLDSCARQPECVAAVGSELAPVIATPTAEGVSATITATTAAGTSTTTQASAGVTVIGDMRLSGVVAYYIWSQGQNGQAQERAKQRYCTAYSNDYVCVPFTGGQGNVSYKFYYYGRNNQKVYLWFSNYWEGTFLGPIKKIQPNGGTPYWRGGYEGWIWEITGANSSVNLYSWFYWAGIYDFPQSIPPYPKIYLERYPNPSEPDNFGNPPPLPWKDWPQQKRDIAVDLLNDSDWQDLVSSMPAGGFLERGDKVNAPTIVIPGREADDLTTQEDERLPKKTAGPYTYPGDPTAPSSGGPVLTPEQKTALLEHPNFERYARNATKEDDTGCIAAPVSGHIGTTQDAPAARYATQVSGSPDDYFVMTRNGVGTTFDGLTPSTRNVWEAKHDYYNFFFSNNPQYTDQARAEKLIEWDGQKNTQMQVASNCEYNLTWAFSDISVAELAQDRWTQFPPRPPIVWQRYLGN